MNISRWILAIAISIFFSAAFAQTAYEPNSGLTRAEVKAEAKQAERSGTIPRGQASLSMGKVRSTPSHVSRISVKAQTKVAEREGQIPRGDAALNMDRDTTVSVLPRRLVKTETLAAEKAHEIPRGEAQANN